jgi:hypothetical protein
MLLIYNDCEISRCGWFDDVDGKSVSKEGFYTADGRFTRFDINGSPYRGGDRTIASLLAGIHYSLGSNFNRFFSYADETNNSEKHIPYEYGGFDFFIEDDEDAIRLLNTEIS